MIDRCLKREVEEFGKGNAKDFNPNMNGISSYYQRGN